MPRNNYSLLFIISLIIFVGIIGLGVLALDRGGGGPLEDGRIKDEMNCLRANLSDNFTTQILESEVSASQLLWNITWGGVDIDRGTAVAVDNDGYLYCTGRTMSYGEGDEDLILIKFYPNGTEIWHSTWGGVDSDWGDDVVVDVDGSIYCVGTTASFGENGPDLALVKFNQNGSTFWNSSVDCGGYEAGEGVAIDSYGYVYCVGRTHQSGQWLLVKFHPNGTKIWHKLWGGPNGDVARDIVVDSNGCIYCTGRIDFSGPGTGDLGLVCFSPNGGEMWRTTWGTPNEDFGFGLTIDTKGALYCTGYMGANTTNRPDLVLIKFYSNGSQAWNSSWGKSFGDAGYGVVLDESGSIYCVGPTRNQVGVHDFVLMQFNPNGTIAWETIWGGSNEEVGSGLAIDRNGSVYCVGRTNSFGAGDYDLALIKYRGDCNYLKANRSDDFDNQNLDPKWFWHTDLQGLSSWSINSDHLRITCPKVPTSWYWEETDVPFMYQLLPQGNWQIEIHVNEPTANEFANGIILYKDINYWMIFANSMDSAGEMNLLRIKEGTAPDNMCGGGRGNNMPYLRLKKMGSLYYCYGSFDGITWSDFGSCYTNTSYIRMGIWAQSHWSGTFSSDFDYFYFEELSEELPPPDPNNKQPLWSYDTGNIVYAVEMTPDGQYIVAGTGNSVYLWDKDSSMPLWSYYTGDVVRAVDISDDGNYIVSAGGVLDHPGDVFLWQRDSPTPLWKFTGKGNFISIGISADGQYFAAGDRLSNDLHFWHKNSSVPLWSFNTGSGNWDSVAISADGNYLVAGDGFYHNYVYYFHTTSPIPIWSYECGSDVWSVDMTPEGGYVTASSKDRRIYLWESSCATPLWSYTTGNEAFSVSISNDGQYIAEGGRDKNIRLFDRFDSTPVWNYLLDSEVWAERAISLSGNGEYIAVGTHNHKIYCFHRDNSNPLWNFSTITGQVEAVALSEDGQYLVAGGKDHKVYLFENFDSQEPSQDENPPEQVTGLTVTAESVGNCLTLAWNPSVAPDFWYYKIYRSTTCGFTPGPGNFLATSMTNTYLDTGLTDDVTYYYRISALDEVPNEGSYSGEASGTPQDFVAPHQVIGFTVMNPTIGKQLDLSWTANTEADLAGYRIYRRTESGSYSLLTTVSRTASSYQDISVTDGITYFYKVAAIDEVPNEGGNSSEAGGISTNVLPPAKVTGLTIVSSSQTSLYLSWTPNTEPDLKWYNIYRSTSRGFTPGPANKIANATTPYYNDTGLIYLQKYYYRVSAEDIADLEGPYSSQKADLGVNILPKPVNVKVMVITTGNTLYLTWDNVSGADTYNIYRDIVPGFIPTPERFIQNVDTNETYDIGLSDNVTYYYRIAGVSPDDVEGHISDEVNNTPVDVDAPPQVTGLIVINPGTGNRLTLLWNASTVSDFNHYRIYRNGSLLTTRTTTTYTDMALLDNLVYIYEISAVDDGGPVPNEGPNSTAVAGTPTDVTAPAQVTGVSVTVVPSMDALELAWVASGAADFDHYNIYRSTNSGFTPGPDNLVANTTVNYYVDTNLDRYTTYFHRISAVDEAGNEGAPSEIRVGSPGPDPSPPTVTGLTITVVPTGNQLNLQWDNLSQSVPYLIGYNIYRSTVSGFTPGAAFLVTMTDQNWYNDTGLCDGTTYYYKVAAVDDDNNVGPIVVQVAGTPSDTVAPTQVTGVVVSVVPYGNTLNIQWDDLSMITPDVMGYNIYRSTTAGFIPNTSTLIATQITNSYLDTGLCDGINYYYRVSALDEVSNEGSSSSEVGGIPSDTTPPPKVTRVRVSKLGSSLLVSWTASAAPDLAYYKVYRSKIPGFSPCPECFIGTTSTNSFTDTNVTGDMRYFYRISAVDDSGNEGAASDTLGGYPFVAGTVSLIVWTSNQTTYVRATITFSSGGFHVSSWGEVFKDGNNLWVNAETWVLTGAGFTQAYWDISHIYEIEHLPGGNYNFIFKVWDNEIISMNFLSKEIITVIPTGNALELTCAMTSTYALDHYNIYRSTSASSPRTWNLIASPGKGSTHYTDFGVIDGVTYYYRVTMEDYCTNEICIIEEVNCSIDNIQPDAPTVTFSIISGDVILIISSTDVDVVYFNIYRSQTSGGPYEFVETYDFTGDPTILIIEMPDPSFEVPMPPIMPEDPIIDPPIISFEFNYYYIITAVDENGNEGPPSNEMYFGLPPLYPPEWVEIGDNGNGDLDLSWMDDFRNDPEFIGGYRIYRMNVSDGTPELIATINSQSIKSYSDYGVPDGKWSYFLTTMDNYGVESSFSVPYNITVKDIMAPGPPIGLNYTLDGDNITIYWMPPDFSNNGADVIGYYIIVLFKSNMDYWEFFQNFTMDGYLSTSCYLGNLPKEIFHITVGAYDDNGYYSFPTNITIDLRSSTIPILVAPPPNEIGAYIDLDVNIVVDGKRGIGEVYLTYSVCNVTFSKVNMSLTKIFPNGTCIFSGEIPGQPAGAFVVFNITVVDKYGYSTTSSSYGYFVVVENELIDQLTLWIVIIILLMGVITISSCYLIRISQNYLKEKRISSILEKVIREPMPSNFSNIGALTSHTDEPRVIISNPFEPVNFPPDSHYQDFAGQSEGFQLIFLFKIFNSLLKVFPTLNELFSRENKIGCITELNMLPFEEQIDMLKDLINGNSENEIRLQLNNLMVELNTAEIEEDWEQLLPKLNYCFDLAQILDDRKYITDLFLLVIIIKCSFRGALDRIIEFVMD